MSQKKIDPKKLVSQIFDRAPAGKSKMAQDELSTLLGRQREKQPIFKGRWMPELPKNFLSWRGWENQFGGIDIGGGSIKFVLLAHDGRRLRLKDVQVEKLTRLNDEVKPEEREREIVNGLVKIASRLPRKTKVGIALNDPALYIDWLTVPSGSQDELRESVRKELAEKNLIDPTTSFFDCASSNGAPTATQDLFVVAAPKDLVYRQFELVQGAGFRVLSIETNALASVEALKRINRWGQGDRVLILDIGHRYSSLSLLIGDRFAFNRIIPIAGERFTKEVQKGLALSFEEAEQLKFKYGLKELGQSRRHSESAEGGRGISDRDPSHPSDAQDDGGDTEGKRVSKALEGEVEKLVAEVERSFQFAFAKVAAEEGPRITNIFLMGGGARLSGLSEYLEKRWQAPICHVNLWEGLPFDERNIEQEFLEETRDLASVALGLALCITEWKVLPFGWGMPG